MPLLSVLSLCSFSKDVPKSDWALKFAIGPFFHFNLGIYYFASKRTTKAGKIVFHCAGLSNFGNKARASNIESYSIAKLSEGAQSSDACAQLRTKS